VQAQIGDLDQAIGTKLTQKGADRVCHVIFLAREPAEMAGFRRKAGLRGRRQNPISPAIP